MNDHVETKFEGLRALFINCTLTPSPGHSHTQLLVGASSELMEKQGVETDLIRIVDHDVATGTWPDMREHGADTDE